MATAKKNNMRILAIVLDEPSSELRNKEVSEMLDYAYAQYELGTAINTDKVLKKAKVEKGYKDEVEIVPSKKVTFLKNKMDEDPKIDLTIDVNNIKAPIKKGDKVGTMKVRINNSYEVVELTVNEDINKITFFQLLTRKFKLIFN